jgi:hypothetical protein
MKAIYSIALAVGLAVIGQAQAYQAEPRAEKKQVVVAMAQEKGEGAEKNTSSQAAEPRVACDVTSNRQQCCSAAQCSGKVLSNRDRHNCKVKSHGKSWHAAAVGGAPAACVRP